MYLENYKTLTSPKTNLNFSRTASLLIRSSDELPTLFQVSAVNILAAWSFNFVYPLVLRQTFASSKDLYGTIPITNWIEVTPMSQSTCRLELFNTCSRNRWIAHTCNVYLLQPSLRHEIRHVNSHAPLCINLEPGLDTLKSMSWVFALVLTSSWLCTPSWSSSSAQYQL